MQLREGQTGALRRGYVATRLSEALQSEGSTTDFDPATGILRATDQLGRTSRLQLGPDGFPQAFTTPMGRQSHLRVNDDALLTNLVEPSGRQTNLTYDQKRAPLSFGRNGIELARFLWNEEYTQNAIEFWDGTRAHGSYSNAGKPLQLTNRTGAAEVFAYDERYRLTALVDGAGRRTQFSYDEEGRPSTTRYSDGRAETVQYDGSGRWVGTLLNGKQLFEREADAEHRPLSVTYADGRKDTFAYDEQGRLAAAEGPEGALRFGYDEAGRPSSEVSGEQTFNLEYDKTGLLTGIEYPGGLRATYGYDADKRLTSVDWGGAVISFSYDREDKQVSSTLSNHLTTWSQLAPSGKPARRTTTNRRTGAVCFDTQYQYDAQDRLTARNDAEQGVRQYVYDGESQLLGVANGAGGWRETFAYDGAGNRIATSGQSVVVDAGNRLLAQGDIVCKYDRRGNVVLISDRTGTWRFKYDLKNQMTEANGPTGVIKFKYDALGRRIEKKTHERTIRYWWCGEGLSREVITTALGQSVREYLYRPGNYEPLALRIDGQCYFYHNDHQGTPQRITDDQGKVVWSSDNFAFGYAQVQVGLIENPLRFAGQYADVETGLHYNRFRYYSPVLGRYLSVDPLRLLAGNNLYLYVRNNPLNKLDGLGLWSVLGVVGAVAAAAAVVVAAPFLLAAAPLIVAVGLLAVEAVSVGKGFCLDCFIDGFGDAFVPGLLMGAGAALLLGAIAVVSAPVAAVIGVAAGCYFAYQMLDQHFGWSGGKPFDQLSPKDKSRAMGRLAGGTVGALMGGLGLGEIVGFVPEGGMPIEDGPGGGVIEGGEVPTGETVEDRGVEGEDPAIEETPDDEAEPEEESSEEEDENFDDDAEASRQQAVDERMQELKEEGHGPQRHGPDVTDEQLNDRAQHGVDPMTGTTTDPNGNPHASSRTASRVNTADDYVAAEQDIKNSPEFEAARQKAEAEGKDRFEVKKPLEEIYGDDYQSKVDGVTRNGPKTPPGTPNSQPPTQTDFTDGDMVLRMRKDANGNWVTTTMYPNPAGQ
jgi:RHS repeat-associated protein